MNSQRQWPSLQTVPTHTLTRCAPDLLRTLVPGGGPPTVTFRWHLEAVAKLADEYDAPGWQRRHATAAGAATGAAGRAATALTLTQLAALVITLTPALPHKRAEVLEECVAALQEPLGAFLAKLDAARWLQVLVRTEPPGRLCLQTRLRANLVRVCFTGAKEGPQGARCDQTPPDAPCAPPLPAAAATGVRAVCTRGSLPAAAGGAGGSAAGGAAGVARGGRAGERGGGAASVGVRAAVLVVQSLPLSTKYKAGLQQRRMP